MDDTHSGMASLAQFAAAKIKLDDLFLNFLISEGQDKIASFLVEASKLQNDDGSMLSERERLGSSESKTSPTSHQSSAGAPKSSLYKKSPKKRTQSEMSSNNSPGNNKSPVSQSTDEMNRLSIGHRIADNNNNNNSHDQDSTVMMEEDNDTNDILTLNINTNKILDPIIPNDQEEQQDEDHTAMRRKKIFDKIPPFYVPGRHAYIGRPVEEDRLVKRHTEIEAFFKPFPGGIPVEK